MAAALMGCGEPETSAPARDGTGSTARAIVLGAADGDECSAGVGACTLAECTDTLDNGFGAGVDTLTDCEDEDCVIFCTDVDGDQACPVGFDTDNSGDCDNTEIDANTEDCFDDDPDNAEHLTEDDATYCSDGQDNDCDGIVDLAETVSCQLDDIDNDADTYCENGFRDTNSDTVCGEGGGGEVDCDDNETDGDESVPNGTIEDDWALCHDGYDNDCADGADFPNDANCDAFDGTETGTADCNDGEDNDNDTLVDEDDPDCVENTFTLCTDSEDNDGDNLTDNPDDPDCDPFDGTETGTADCNDGEDNDGDTLVDSADPDCVENTAPLCTDGEDNDGDNDTDIDDTDCAPFYGAETGTTFCNDNIDNDGDLLVDENDPDCVENTFALCNDSEDNDGDGLEDAADPDCLPYDGTETGTADCNDGFDNDGDTLFDSADPDCVENTAPLCTDGFDNDGDSFTDDADPDCAAFYGPETGTLFCNDGIDNDLDTLTDFLDPNCVENTFAMCTDGQDNDGDGLTDNPNDPDCAAFDGTETGALDCNDGEDNDGDNDVDNADSDCVEDTYLLCTDGLDNDGDSLTDNPADPDCAPYDGTETGAADCNDGFDNDGDTLLDNADPDCVENNFALCTDGLDNDGDTLTDAADPDCAPFGAENTYLLCIDNIDNDGDGNIDGDDNNCNPFEDNDGDGYCEDPFNCIDGSTPDDCDDTRPQETPNKPENTAALCSDVFDNDCDGNQNAADTDCDPFEDNDGDGFCEDPFNCIGGATPDDCNDAVPQEAPNLTETSFAACGDAFDNDCDGDTNGDDSGCDPFEDDDGDGFCEAANCIDGSDPDDCNDAQPTMFPRAAEPVPLCIDGLDNDCNFLADLADPNCANVSDTDGDGFCQNGQDTNANGTCTTAAETALPFDCNEGVDTIFPGADEVVADGIDQDCDAVDECYRDNDNDNWGLPTTLPGLTLNCTADANRAPQLLDCDDGANGVNPDEDEIVADGIDQDCDTVDDCYRDDDNDEHGSNLIRTGLSLDCENDPSRSLLNDDCDDNDGLNFPGNPEVCDGQDNNCNNLDDFGNPGVDNWETDNDGDGFSECQLDCDDSNPQRYVDPGHPEIVANNLDEDCDQRELCYRDVDGDTFGNEGGATQLSAANQAAWACTGTGLSPSADDCNDAAGVGAPINPAATEVPADNLDQNCDDDELCWRDDDGDGHGRDASYAPNQTILSVGNISCAQAGESVLADDCVDDEPNSETIYLGADEVLNDGIDQNCDGFDAVDCYADGDNDGFGRHGTTVQSIDGGCDFVGASYSDTDCDDTNASFFPGAPDACDDGLDQNCSGPANPVVPPRPAGPGEIDDDGDTLFYSEEQAIGTSDCTADTDGDSLADNIEDDNGSNPLVQDTDGDGVRDDAEYTGGANPSPLDTDGDGLDDFEDPDDDGDGVTTLIEFPLGNSDPDGLPDYLDPDDDNDGIPTIEEGGPGLNTDALLPGGDTLPDYRDADDDGDGIATSVEDTQGNGRTVDFDMDGIVGHLDPDSDNDGVDDGEEWGGTTGPPRNSDGAGGPDIHDTDDDGDSILTLVEGDETVDTDQDGIPDYLDLDSDADDVEDGDEAATACMDFQSADTDGDGVDDGIEYGLGDTPLNTDDVNGSPFRDLIIDACDTDDDGDNILTSAEVGLDTDFDLIPDYLDADDDEDSVPSWTEDEDDNGNGLDDDTDGDLIPNARDDDDDGDGIQTIYEELFGANRLSRDTDGDSVEDNIEWGCPFGTATTADRLACDISASGFVQYAPMLPRNTDFEYDKGAPSTDPDALYGLDNVPDGIADGAVGCQPLSTPGAAPDPSSPGTWDSFVGNSDGIIDVLDPDDDNDSIPTGFGSGGLLGEGGAGQDSDIDGIPDYRDMDSDNDSFAEITIDGVTTVNGPRPDACELGSGYPDPVHDVDSDTIPNWVDAIDFDGAEGDPDGDNLSSGLEIVLGLDAGSPDSDADGVLDCTEVGIVCTSLPAAYIESTLPVTPLNSDGDQTIDAADEDDDDDGISSEIEVFWLINSDGSLGENRYCPAPFETFRPVARWFNQSEHLFFCPDGSTMEIEPDENQRDGDGIPNRLDSDDDGDGVPTFNEDYNGNSDWFDDDSDGDALVDFLDVDDWDGPLADPDLDGFSNAEEEILCAILGLNSEECDILKHEDDYDDDGIPDAIEVGDDINNPLDTDQDGIYDLVDEDDDGDCIPSAVEGVGDTDGDGVPDFRDLDSDGDGVDDELEWFGAEQSTCPDPLPDGPDTDCDGLLDPWDSNDADFAGADMQECLGDIGPPPEDKTCACNAGASGSGLGFLLGALLVAARRRRPAA